MRCSLIGLAMCLAIGLEIGSLSAEDAEESFTNAINPLRLRSTPRDSKPNGRWVEWRAGTRWEGEYQEGQRHGDWTGAVPASAQGYFAEPEFADFARPIEVTVHLNEGVPHGQIKAVDAEGRPVFAWHFDQGVLEGKAAWWHANGQLRRQARYRAGLLDGPVTEWNKEGAVTKQDTYREGRRGGSQVVWYEAGRKHIDGQSHMAGEISRDSFDVLELKWTSTKVDEYPHEERCGRWTAWHTNGQKKLEGSYVEGQAEGRYTWWHENGQKRAEGEYLSGKRHGSWRWWHENGRKRMEGEFEYGQATGHWQAWTEVGSAAAVDRTLAQMTFDWDDMASESRAAKRNTLKRPTLGAATEPATAPVASVPTPVRKVEPAPTVSKPSIVAKPAPASTKPAPVSSDPPIRSGLASKIIRQPTPRTTPAATEPAKPGTKTPVAKTPGAKTPVAVKPADPGSSQEFTLLGLLNGQTGQTGGQTHPPAKQPRSPTLAEEMGQRSQAPETAGPSNILTELFGLQPASPPPHRTLTKPIRR